MAARADFDDVYVRYAFETPVSTKGREEERKERGIEDRLTWLTMRTSSLVEPSRSVVPSLSHNKSRLSRRPYFGRKMYQKNQSFKSWCAHARSMFSIRDSQRATCFSAVTIACLPQNMKKIQTEQQAAERYRLQVSDGTNFQPCMLATQMNPKISSGELDRFSIVRVIRYLCNTVHDRRSGQLFNCPDTHGVLIHGVS